MADLVDLAREIQSAAGRFCPSHEVEVDGSRGILEIKLLRGPDQSSSGYFPFGKIYPALSEIMTEGMLKFWTRIDQAREILAGRLGIETMDWSYSIGASDRPYETSLEEKELVEDEEELQEESPSRAAARTMRELARGLLEESNSRVL